ncbi:MAG: glycosyltransferase family 4 protein [Pseudomonadales bacterium]|nr:glycosyltransferase family 4 protein [Candidatus Woesebacteria bacterium]MCB9802161.1 glycosyltransferase family 4 protein [Pseudomonadales bacterium]
MPQAVIGIDCRLGGKQHAGIGRYIQNIVTQVVTHTEYTWVLFFRSQDQVREFFPNKLPKSVKVVLSPERHYTLREQTSFWWRVQRQPLALFHTPHFNVPVLYQGKLVVTIHDLLWHQHKGSAVTTLGAGEYYLKYLMYRVVTSIACKKADSIITPSNTIAEVVSSYYPETKEKLLSIYEGAEIASQQKQLDAYRPNKQLLYVGSLYPHKNIELVLRALQKLPDYTLTLVGSRSVFLDTVLTRAGQLGVKKQLDVRGFVPDAELFELYHSHLALIQPSTSEGFGLTGVEALVAGGCVLASDIPIFREIYQEYAQYFDPLSTASFVQAVKNIEKKRPTLTNAQKNSLQTQFSWDKAAQQTLEVYQDVLGNTT